MWCTKLGLELSEHGSLPSAGSYGPYQAEQGVVQFRAVQLEHMELGGNKYSTGVAGEQELKEVSAMKGLLQATDRDCYESKVGVGGEWSCQLRHQLRYPPIPPEENEGKRVEFCPFCL